MDAAQRRSAERARDAESARRNCSVLLDVWDADQYEFWKAEEYHQQFDFKSGEGCSGSGNGKNIINNNNGDDSDSSNNTIFNSVRNNAIAAQGEEDEEAVAHRGHAVASALTWSQARAHEAALRPRK